MRTDRERRVTVVVPAWNSQRWLKDCLTALEAQTFRAFSVLVVDSNSTDGSTDELTEEFPQVEVLRLPINRGFASAVNAAIRRTSTPYVALLNVDTEARPTWLAELVACLEDTSSEVAGVASKMLRTENPERIDDAGDGLSWYGSAVKRGHNEPAEVFDKREEVLSVSAAAALYRTSFLRRVEFDSVFESYFEDVDVGLRGRILGYRFLFEPRAEVLHWGGGSGLSRGRYVTLVTRNRLMTLVKSIPSVLLLRHLPRLAWGLIYFFIAYRRPLRSLAGYVSFARHLPRVLRERGRLGAERALSNAAIDSLLSDSLGEPPLRSLFRRWLRQGLSREPSSEVMR